MSQLQQKLMFDIERICRICTLNSSVCTFIHIDAEIYDNLKIADALESLTNLQVKNYNSFSNYYSIINLFFILKIKINPNDGGPQQICAHCKKRLADAIHLQLLAKSSAKLLAYLSSNSNDNNICNVTEEHFQNNMLPEEMAGNHINSMDTSSMIIEENHTAMELNEISSATKPDENAVKCKSTTSRKVKRKPVKRMLNRKVNFSPAVSKLDADYDDEELNEIDMEKCNAADEQENNQRDDLSQTTKRSRTIATNPKRTTKTIDDVERLERIHLAFQSNVQPVYENSNEINITHAISKILTDASLNDDDDDDKPQIENKPLITDDKQLIDSISSSTSSSQSTTTTNQISVHSVDIKTEIDHNSAIIAAAAVPPPQKTNDAYQKRKHTCQVCGKKFIGKSNLVDHLRYHANVKPFACKFCGKNFVQKGTLICHLRTHTQEKPYSCTICEKTFSQASAKNVHIKTHTNERNHVCDVCEKRFITSGDLSKHKRIHQMTKKFICEICQRGFSQKVNYVKHKYQVHGIKVNN